MERRRMRAFHLKYCFIWQVLRQQNSSSPGASFLYVFLYLNHKYKCQQSRTHTWPQKQLKIKVLRQRRTRQTDAR